MKARQVAEAESRETTAALEEAARARSEADDRITTLTRECSQLQSQLDENEEELAEVSIYKTVCYIVVYYNIKYKQDKN